MPENPNVPDDIGVAPLLAGDDPDGPVGVPLGIKVEHLELFAGIDSAAFQHALERFSADRPFVTTEDALRAVRNFGVRAKLIPEHADIVEWAEPGWQLAEVHPGELDRSRQI